MIYRRDNTHLEFPEPERYELHEEPFYHFEISRREFVGILGVGLVLSVAVPNLTAQRSRSSRPVSLAQRLHISPDGVITVLTSKVEVGQGSRTQLTQAAAEELHLPVDKVRFIMADTQLTPDDGGTAGSRTTPSSVPTIRKACAAARQLLIETAASVHGVDARTLSVVDGKVRGLPADKTFSYADLGSDKHSAALKQEAAPETPIADVKEWRVLGSSVPHVTAKEIVTGAHKYPSDIRRPGMLYGKVLRPPGIGSKLEKIDLSATEKMDGVTAVRDGDFVGFAASTSFAASEARDAAGKTAQWTTPPHPSSKELYAHLRAKASGSGRGRSTRGEPDNFLKNGAIRQTYEIAYIQHAPMEPRAAVAEWKDDGSLTVWTGTQQPSRVREDLAGAFKLSRDKVRVIVPDTGGGFGGKHSGEAAVEAARLALAAKKPVSLLWTREEEFTWAYCRPAGVIDVAAVLEDGKVAAWEHVNINSGGSAIDTPYAIPNVATHFKSSEQPLRSGSYRALASTANAFARESFMDELAASLKFDPLEFRLRHLTHERLKAVLLAATEKFGWTKAWKDKSNRIGVGLGCGTEKGSYVACCARIEVDASAGSYKVLEVVQAFECGAIQNPANLKAQVEGCIIQGLGALREEMRFEDGKILNPKFSQYAVPRFKDVPVIDTILVNRPDLASIGGGETPIIAIAPAVANALFHATGARIRSLPLRNEKWALHNAQRT